jgi:protocatechuate 3,4-dioxygenase beta subunit
MNKRREFLKNTALSAVAFSIASPIKGSTQIDNNADTLNCNKTTLDYYGKGPFYSENPPLIANNKLAKEDEVGIRLILAGRVFNIDCSQFIPNTKIDVWHANNAGKYDNQGFNLRGFTFTNEQGFYMIETILPGKYLNGSSFRPAHIHFKITPPSFPELITQLYFQGDTSIPGDAAASITSGTYNALDRIITLTTNVDNIKEGTFDIIIDGKGLPVGTNDLHLDKGMVYKASPNPFIEELHIQYGVFKKAKVGLYVYDIQGHEVAQLEDKIMSAEKYMATWIPSSNVVPGHYFIALKINDLQVHYLRVLKV